MSESDLEILPEKGDETVDLGFSMRMDESQLEAELPPDLFAVRPDTKGPRSIGILLILGALVLLGQAYGDIGLHNAADLSDEEVGMILEVPNSQVMAAAKSLQRSIKRFTMQHVNQGVTLFEVMGSS